MIAALLAGAALTVPGAVTFPESLAVAPDGATYYVSSYFSGTVARGPVAGGTASVFSAAGTGGRASATGVKVDRAGRVLVLDGRRPRLQVLAPGSGAVLGTLTGTPRAGSTLNDLALMPDGEAYISDFGHPAVYRVAAADLRRARGRIRPWLSLRSGAPFNGIVGTADGRHLLVGQTASGGLERVDVATRRVVALRIRGGSLVGSDGMLLRGRTLYVALHGNAVAQVTLNTALTTATITRRITDPSFSTPTSVALSGSELLVSNAAAPAGADYAITALPVAG